MKIEELSIEEKIGQMFIVGMDTTDVLNKVDDLILKYKIGGILLYKKNYRNYEELIKVVNYIKNLNKSNKVPLFIAIDQEGGRVNRMPPDFENIPPANKLVLNSKEINLVKQAGKITGEMLQKTGFNLDFAPVLDIKRFADKHAIGDRAFSENIEEVIKYGIDYMKELQNKRVVPAIKHFPGHGATTKDSHIILPVIKKKMEELEKEDMIPFTEAIKNGADTMLVGHLQIPEITKKYPATMSKKFVTKYIRKKCRYKGVIITDDMRMKGVKLLYGSNKPIKKAFEAGYDIILMKHIDGNNIIDKIIKEVKKSHIKQAKVNKSVKRILELKEKYRVNDEAIDVDKNWLEEINEKVKKCQNVALGNVPDETKGEKNGK